MDRVDWEDRSSCPKRTKRTARRIEDRILQTRRRLKKSSDLGEYGADAIHAELIRAGIDPCPSIRTIGRILERRGALDAKRRVRRPAPQRGWYLPRVAAGEAELDSFDTIEGLAIRGGSHLSVFTGISLHSGLVGTWIGARIRATDVVEALLEHWESHGLPGYALFDNDNRFCGPRQHRDAIGRVIRLCLHVGVVPVFSPPVEYGFRADIESYNGRWQAKVWNRVRHRSIAALRNRSDRYVEAVVAQKAQRLESSPARAPLPQSIPDLGTTVNGCIVFLRRTTDGGRAQVLGRRFNVDPMWPHRLVRAEVDLDQSTIRFYAPRRRDPSEQPLLNEIPYKLPQKPWRG